MFNLKVQDLTDLTVIELLKLLKQKTEKRFMIHSYCGKYWIQKEADQSLEYDWFNLDEDGNYAFMKKTQTKYYESLEEAEETKLKFVRDTMSEYCQYA